MLSSAAVKGVRAIVVGYNADSFHRIGIILILYRYINKQLFTTTIVIAFVLALVMVSGRFIGYLAQAATGEISADAVFKVLALRMPEFLQMLLPLALFMAILLVFGRMYVDNEMGAMRAGGIGVFRDARAIVVPVICMTLLMAVFSLWISPRGDLAAKQVFDAQASRSALELITPGRFLVRSSDGSYRATYTEGVDRDAGMLKNIFISEMRRMPGKKPAAVSTVLASEGRVVTHDNGISYLQLDDGTQYQGRPGEASYTIMQFDRAQVRIDRNQSSVRPPKVRSWSTAELLASDQANAEAEWQWRLALIIMTPLMAFLAVPMAKVNPRQGRFNRLAPALFIYLLYFGMLMTVRSWIGDQDGGIPVYLNLLWVHLGALVIVLVAYLWPEWVRMRKQRKAAA